MLYAQLQFPALSLEALGTDYVDTCVAVHDGHVIRQASPRALSAGVLPGMTIGMALTLCDTLTAHPRAPKKEQRLLHQLAHWAYHFSNQVAIRESGLCLEIGKSERLFGAPAELVSQLKQSANRAGRPMRIALGDTPEMADVFLKQQHCPMPDAFQDALKKTPLSLTGLPDKALRRLSLMGFRTLGDYVQVPTRAKQKRLSTTDFAHLEAILGRRTTPLTWFTPPPVFLQSQSFLRGLESHDMLRFPMHRLSQEASRWLCHQHRASDCLNWTLTLENRQKLLFSVRLNRPEWQADILFEPSWLTLQTHTLAAPVVEVSLRIQNTHAQHSETHDFFQKTESNDRGHLLDRLKARLGDSAIYSICRLPDPRPEKANQWHTKSDFTEPPPLPPRPVWWVTPPEPLGLQPELKGHELVQGPERLESGWWDFDTVCRQYWISRHAHRLAWIYQDQHTKQWWLSGWFA